MTLYDRISPDVNFSQPSTTLYDLFYPFGTIFDLILPLPPNTWTHMTLFLAYMTSYGLVPGIYDPRWPFPVHIWPFISFYDLFPCIHDLIWPSSFAYMSLYAPFHVHMCSPAYITLYYIFPAILPYITLHMTVYDLFLCIYDLIWHFPLHIWPHMTFLLAYTTLYNIFHCIYYFIWPFPLHILPCMILSPACVTLYQVSPPHMTLYDPFSCIYNIIWPFPVRIWSSSDMTFFFA